MPIFSPRPFRSLTGASAEARSTNETDAPKGGAEGTAPSSSAPGDASGPSHLVPNNPEVRYREVLAVPLARRPLFPGGIMPVMVTNNALIKELVDIRRQGYVALRQARVFGHRA